MCDAEQPAVGLATTPRQHGRVRRRTERHDAAVALLRQPLPHLDRTPGSAQDPTGLDQNRERPWLEIAAPDRQARRLDLDGGVVRIGRSWRCEVRSDQKAIAKMHAEIRLRDGSFHVADLGSRSGLFVNGARTGGCPLRAGDLIEFGNPSPLAITFRDGAAARPAPTPPAAAPPSAAAPAAAPPSAPESMARLARFFEFSRKLGGAFSLEEVLRDVVDLAIEVTGAERGMLAQRCGDGRLELRVARDGHGEALPLEGLRPSETLVRQAEQTRVPLIVPDVGEDAELAATQSIVSLELRSAVILPLTRLASAESPADAGGEVFGLLYLDSRHRRERLAGLDLRILERLAQDASAAIENARLLREAEDKRRIEREVSMARDVQAMLIPSEFTSSAAFAIAGLCVPCLELGGDYVDQFDLGGGRTVLVVADVCGKGIAASLLAASLQGALLAEIHNGRPLRELAARLNRVHCTLAPSGQFITMALLTLEPDGTVRYVNAGHLPPLHVQADGVARLEAHGLALGLDEDAVYEDIAVTLRPGELLVVYSDGVVECQDPDRELYGMSRLEELLASRRGQEPQAVLDAIVADTEVFRRGADVGDDFSAIALRRA